MNTKAVVIAKICLRKAMTYHNASCTSTQGLCIAESARAAATMDDSRHIAAVQHEGCYCRRLPASIQSKQNHMLACQAGNAGPGIRHQHITPRIGSICMTGKDKTSNKQQMEECQKPMPWQLDEVAAECALLYKYAVGNLSKISGQISAFVQQLQLCADWMVVTCRTSWRHTKAWISQNRQRSTSNIVSKMSRLC